MLPRQLVCLSIAAVVLFSGGSSLGQDGGGSLLDRKLALARLFLDADYPDALGVLEPELENLAREKGVESSEAGTHRELLLDLAARHEKAGDFDAAVKRYEAVRGYPRESDPKRYNLAAVKTGEIYLARAERETDDDKKADALERAAKDFADGGDVAKAKTLQDNAMGIRLADALGALKRKPPDYDRAYTGFQKVSTQYPDKLRASEHGATWDDLQQNTGIFRITEIQVTARGADLAGRAEIRLAPSGGKGEALAEKLAFREFRWPTGTYECTVKVPGEGEPFFRRSLLFDARGAGVAVPNRKPDGMIFVPEGRVDVPGRGMVSVPNFFIDKNEVTYSEIQAFIKARRPSWDTWHDQPRHPATDVQYQEAMDYARSIGKKLPTQEQWMRAAFGDANARYDAVNSKLTGEAPELVGGRTANPFGISNMGGNVSEWLENGWVLGGSFKTKSLVKPLGVRMIQRDFMRDPRPGPRVYSGMQGTEREDYRPYQIIEGRNTEEVGLRCVIDL